MEAFQRDHGLTVDGAAGKQTQSLLFSSASDPAPGPDALDTPLPTAAAITPTPSSSPTPAPTAPMVVPEYVPRAPVEDSVG